MYRFQRRPPTSPPSPPKPAPGLGVKLDKHIVRVGLLEPRIHETGVALGAGWVQWWPFAESLQHPPSPSLAYFTQLLRKKGSSLPANTYGLGSWPSAGRTHTVAVRGGGDIVRWPGGSGRGCVGGGLGVRGPLGLGSLGHGDGHGDEAWGLKVDLMILFATHSSVGPAYPCARFSPAWTMHPQPYSKHAEPSSAQHPSRLQPHRASCSPPLSSPMAVAAAAVICGHWRHGLKSTAFSAPIPLLSPWVLFLLLGGARPPAARPPPLTPAKTLLSPPQHLRASGCPPIPSGLSCAWRLAPPRPSRGRLVKLSITHRRGPKDFALQTIFGRPFEFLDFPLCLRKAQNIYKLYH
jgi:hypothetical protein